MSGNNDLEKEFNFENAVKNPYAGKLKKTGTASPEEEAIFEQKNRRSSDKD